MVGQNLLAVVLTAAALFQEGSCERPPTITHQNPYVDAGLDPLAGYMSIRDNVTEYMPERRRAVTQVSEWNKNAAIFKRQTTVAGAGALLCPTGECADGS